MSPVNAQQPPTADQEHAETVAGSLELLLEKYGLTPAAIAETVAATLAAADHVANATDMDCTGGLS